MIVLNVTQVIIVKNTLKINFMGNAYVKKVIMMIIKKTNNAKSAQNTGINL